MRKSKLSIQSCALLLLLALCWRMLGAPISKTDFENLQTPIRQARLLLPERVAEMLRLWVFEYSASRKETALDGGKTQEEEKVLVYLHNENKLVEMTLEGYVRGVVAEEMPAQYHAEALKAQAVAARTRALWQKAHGGCESCTGADICTDSMHCQGYASLSECKQKWGDSYDCYCERIVKAQRETQGQWISYEQQPIEVFYHAISGGRTENVQSVFSQSLPYLVSVESANEEAVRGYQQESYFSFDEVAQKLNQSHPEMQLKAEKIRRSFAVGGYTESGRVAYVLIGSEKVPGDELRRSLNLRSTWFSISTDDHGITFHQRGYGHGVGMSQAGANVMASQGSDYEEILKHYYTGIELVKPEAG